MQNTMFLNNPLSVLCCLCILISICVPANAEAVGRDVGQMVSKEERMQLVETEYGAISAVNFSEGIRGQYHLQFIKMEPNSLFLPVQLHADMVLFVHTGTGRLVWTDGDDIRRVDLRRGDIFRVRPGSVFYIQSNLMQEREKLRINAIFTSTDEEFYDPRIGAYSSITDLYTGFDKRVLQSALKVPEEIIEEITNASKPQAIVHAVPGIEPTFWETEARLLKALLAGDGTLDSISNKEKKGKTYNILDGDPDVENCNGWSRTVTRKDFHQLKGSHIGFFMVNLTKGSMMGPHWNPKATEIAVVLKGRGMVRIVCANSVKDSNCKNKRFRVKEGDVFSVPRFHPMAQISFNNDSLSFIGFSSTTKGNHPQFLAGKNSVLQTLDKQILALSFNVSNSTIDQILAAQDDSIILECTSCAEEEEMIMEEEIQKERREAARKKEEEEAKRREEEIRRREQEEAKKREEEEARKRKEEERKKREEERRREEEEEEEARRREAAAAARQREEERRREEEEAERRRKEEEEETRRRREEEEATRREREAERKRREQEQQREEEAARRQERERRQREQEEAERQRREEEEGRREQPEKEERRREPGTSEEEEARREEEERRRRGGRGAEEAGGRQRGAEEAGRREQPEEEERGQEPRTSEEEVARREEEERQRRGGQGAEEAGGRRRIEEEDGRREQPKESGKSEEEEATKEEEERRRRAMRGAEEARGRPHNWKLLLMV